MSDRCEECGSYLQPGAVVCDVCQSPVGSSLGSGVNLGDPLYGGGPGASPGLELEVVRAPRKRPPQAPRAAARASGRPPAPRPSGAPPSPQRVDPNAPSQFEVARVANYPSPPPNVLYAVPYAMSVFTRQRELRRELADATRLREAADQAAELSLVKLGELTLGCTRVHTGLEGEVHAALGTMSDRDGMVASVARSDEAFASARRGLEARLAALRQEVNPLKDRETRLQTQVSMKQQDAARFTARIQRIDIELRNASPDQRGSLEAERAAREGDLRLANVPLQQLNQELAELRRQLADKTHEVAALEDELQRGEQARERDRAQRAREVGHQDRATHVALRTLGDATRVRGLANEVDPIVAGEVERLIQAYKDRCRIEEVQRRAVDSYDLKAYRQGAGILGAAAALILAMVVVAALT